MARPPRPEGAPIREHRRSHAALRVGSLSDESHLMLAHFEQRVRLTPPPTWLRDDGNKSARHEGWQQGVLAEPKYLVFRHDAMIGSFHPRHRAKWTAHELCHRLVGYAYKPGATLLWHTLAAWAAELLPVALWYFFDEAGLRRCERHEGSGPLFSAHCDKCDELALHGMQPRMPSDDTWIERGISFVTQELNAIERSAKAGKPIGTRHASIHLASDALGYVGSHRFRLLAPEMERFVSDFVGSHQGHHASLESLLDRVREACNAIAYERPLAPWSASRWDWIAQDVGYRLLTVRASLATGQSKALDEIIDQLAKKRTKAGLTRIIEDYVTLERRDRRAKGSRLPRPEDMFAVGYDLPLGFGRSHTQILEGVVSALPGTCDALGKKLPQHITEFIAKDVTVRRGIGERFAEHLAKQGAIYDLARIEAAITHAPQPDSFAANLDSFEYEAGTSLTLSQSARIVRLDHDVLDIEATRVRRARKLEAPRYLIVSRSAQGSVDLLEIDASTAKALSREQGVPENALRLPSESLDTLLRTGTVVPVRYRL